MSAVPVHATLTGRPMGTRIVRVSSAGVSLGLGAVLALAVGAGAGTVTRAPLAGAGQARAAVYNLIETNRETCPIVKWKFQKVVQGTFRGISHPGRGKLLWKVTARIEWAGSMFLHDTSWTVVGSRALPADMNPLTGVVYRDREAEWIGAGCLGSPPFGHG